MPTLFGLDPITYTPSPLHGADRTFRETNCYVDLWIELLHAAGIDASSAMAFTCAIDFEGDQWSFFKPPPEDLMQLYGIDVHEMQLYRPLVEHIVERVNDGKTMIIESDAFYMPDREATSYRRAHVKSSIAIEAIDPIAESLRYFHGPGYYELSGHDYRGTFRLAHPLSDDVLPPYAETVRFDAGPRLTGADLRYSAYDVLRRNLARGPKHNPWTAFGKRLSLDLPNLLAGSETCYHAYAFATLRQCGAAFELAKSFLEWLCPSSCSESSSDAGAAGSAFARQVSGAKVLAMKLARRRPFDPEPIMQALAADWNLAMHAVDSLAYGIRRESA
jgi:hypothetical protein